MIDIVNHVSGDSAENGAETANDPRLLAVGDVVVADNMATDGLFCPTIFYGPFDGLVITAGGGA